MLIDFEGSELNHLRAIFFNVIEKALHLMGTKGPAKVILDLEGIHMLLGVSASIVRLHVNWRLEPFGKWDAHNIVGGRHFVTILRVLQSI